MCPKLKNTICTLVDIGPEHVECVIEEHCLGDGWQDCNLYFSQFFLDKNDEYIE